MLRREQFEMLERMLFDHPVPAEPGDPVLNPLAVGLPEPHSSSRVLAPASMCSVSGESGVGKSVLAAAVARSPLIARRFPDGVFWIGLGSSPRLTVLQSQLATRLGKPCVFDSEQRGRATLVDILAERAVLLVLDDVRDAAHAALFAVTGAPGRTLLTTREGEIGSAVGAQQLHLDAPPVDQARTLLARWAGRRATDLPADCDAIIELCGRLPLALALIGAIAGDGVRSWIYLRRALEQGPNEALARAIQIGVDNLQPALRDAYADLAVFESSTESRTQTIQALWQNTSEQTETRLSVFEDRALIGRDSARQTVSMHNALHQWTQTQRPERTALHERIARTLTEMWQRARDNTAQEDGPIWQLGVHLLGAGDIHAARHLWWDFHWLRGKLKFSGLAAVIAELDSVGAEMQTLKQALTMSRTALVADTNQLPGHLLGRLEALEPQSNVADTARIQVLLTSVRSWNAHSWLRPLTPALEPSQVADTSTGDASSTQRMHSHVGPILAMDVSADQSTLVTASVDSTLRVWDGSTHRERLLLAGHRGEVCCVALFANGTRALTASDDACLRIWDVQSGQLLRTFTDQTMGVRELAVSADGSFAVGASTDGGLHRWNLKGDTVEPVESRYWPGFANGRAQTFPDRDTDEEEHDESWMRISTDCLTWRGALAAADDAVFAAPPDNTLQVWRGLSPQQSENLDLGHQIKVDDSNPTVNQIRVSADGRYVFTTTSDHSIRIWNLETRSSRTLSGHWERINRLAVTPDGHRLVSGSLDGTLRLWDIDTGAEVRILDDCIGSITDVSVAPNSAMAMSAAWDGTVTVWDLWHGARVAVFVGDAPVLQCRWVSVNTIALGDLTGRVYFLRLIESHQDTVSRLFARAIELDDSERENFLDRVCDDPEIRKDVAWLVAAEHQYGDTKPVDPVQIDPANDLSAGTQIKHYRITRELGRGGMSQVFLAHDTRLDRPVAMKFLMNQEEEFRTLFEKEAKMTARCRHENIVVIHDVDEHDGRSYLVLEYLQGKSMRDWMNERNASVFDPLSTGSSGTPLMTERALEIGLAVVRALVHAHAVGIVHRDLKPENIFITDTDTIKVLDFGIAKATSANSTRDSAVRTLLEQGADVSSGHLLALGGRLIGTPAYMSPEQWNSADVDHKTDIWSFGMVLFELLLGRHPLAPLSAQRVTRIARLDEPMPHASEALPDIGELAYIIDRCLRKERSERFPDARELLKVLNALIVAERSGPVVAIQQPRESSSGRVMMRSGTDILGLGTGFLLAPDLLVTAFRVVGDPTTRTWRHEILENASYTIQVDGSLTEVTLEPLVFDPATELALMRCERPVFGLSVLELAPRAPIRDAPWTGQAYPEFLVGSVELSGTVVELRGDDAASSLRLSIHRGSQMKWRGVPGTPIRSVDTGQVLGVITQLTDETATGWGATMNAVQRLLQKHREGAQKSRLPRSWRRCIDLMVRYLRNERCIGVALLERAGFGAREAADELLRRIRSSDERISPVRLAPDRSSTDEARIYKKLLRGLQIGLKRAPELRITGSFWQQLRSSPGSGEPWEQFQDALEDLLIGPLADNSQRLLLLVDGLARLPHDQVVRWGYMMKGLCDEGLQLVVWGSMELHELTVAPQHGNESSAFHHLERVHLPAFDVEDIEDMTLAYLEDDRPHIAERIHTLTGGHPALVRDVFAMPTGVLDRGGDGEIITRLLGSTHMERLRREVERDERIQRVLRSFVEVTSGSLPREPLSIVEKQMWWLGLVEEAEDGGWKWFAPVMRSLVGEAT